MTPHDGFLDLHSRLIEMSIETLRMYNPATWWRSRSTWVDPYYGCFSGGKDSCVIKELAKMADVPVTWHYNVTTIDPPELYRFIRDVHPDVIRHRPERNFFAVMRDKGFPTRRGRWCCEKFKENASPPGARLIMGIRAAESSRRASNWTIFTPMRNKSGVAINPILHWKKNDVWQFIREHDLPYCSLYDEGFTRLGCVGCPMTGANQRKREFARWPRIAALWRKTFKEIWDKRTGSKQRDGRQWFGDRFFKNDEELWQWWLNDDPLPGKKCEGVHGLWY